MNNIFKTNIILFSFSLSFSLIGCSDDIIDAGGTGAGDNKGIGEMVQFTVGTTSNSVTSRADTKNYYMADGSRFVCRMYYVAHTESDKIDVTEGTDFMAWLKVNGTVGNSLYWNKFYEDLKEPETIGYGGKDNLGNDYSADAFYWQNRKKHVFLAMTDLNQATSDNYKYGIDPGKLKLTPADISYKIKEENATKVWEPVGYTIQGVEGTFQTWEEVKTYVEEHGENDEFKAAQAACAIHNNDWLHANYEYMYGWSCKFSNTYATTTEVPATEEGETPKEIFGPIQYLMYYETFPYTDDLPDGYTTVEDEKTKKPIAYRDKYGIYLCNVIYEKDAAGNETSHRVKTDDYGNTLYNEANPKYTFYYNEIKEEHSIIKENTYNMNAYDLSRGETTSMSQQPDICQAITEQAPLGATQASNRVNLYFKHQFSQVQVNLKNANDNSVNITREQIEKVELLGVTDQGYVCVDLNDNGEINHTPLYKTVNAADYTTDQLKANPYGTAFNMYDMYDESKGSEDNFGYALGYLKSFQCITFGQLQAIRITWKETTAENALRHTATFRVSETNLQNLQSGIKYIWNMELRRGTLAVIRTELEDWIVPHDKANPEDPYSPLEYGTDGTIHN